MDVISQGRHGQKQSLAVLLAWLLFLFTFFVVIIVRQHFDCCFRDFERHFGQAMPTSTALPTMKPRHPESVIDIMTSSSVSVSFFILFPSDAKARVEKYGVVPAKAGTQCRFR